MGYDYSIVDSFTSEPGMGNPAAVVLDARGLADDRMQEIAARFNVSETAFVLPAEKGASAGGEDMSVRFRWFSPTVEVGLCGHATVAGLYALYDSGRLDPWRDDPAIHIRIETRSGDLDGFIEKNPGGGDRRMIWLTLPPPRLSPFEPDWSGLASAMAMDCNAFAKSVPPVRTRDDDLIVFVRDVATLNAIVPDFDRLGLFLAGCNARGLSLATTSTLTPSLHVQSRFFAPNLGVNEDPVTGSVTGPLAVHLVREGKVAMDEQVAAIACAQGIPGGRTGLVYALVTRNDQNEYDVRIGGNACVVDRGTLNTR